MLWWRTSRGVNAGVLFRRRLLFENRTFKRTGRVPVYAFYGRFIEWYMHRVQTQIPNLVISRSHFQFSISNSIKSRFANEGSIDRNPVLRPFWKRFLAPKATHFQRIFCCEAAKLAPEASICSKLTDFAVKQQIGGPFEAVL